MFESLLQLQFFGRKKMHNYPCPYYARGASQHPLTKEIVLFPNPGSNQCPFRMLLEMAHAPCKMEMAGDIPEWERCPLKNNPAVQDIVRKLTPQF